MTNGEIPPSNEQQGPEQSPPYVRPLITVVLVTREEQLAKIRELAGQVINDAKPFDSPIAPSVGQSFWQSWCERPWTARAKSEHALRDLCDELETWVRFAPEKRITFRRSEIFLNVTFWGGAENEPILHLPGHLFEKIVAYYIIRASKVSDVNTPFFNRIPLPFMWKVNAAGEVVAGMSIKLSITEDEKGAVLTIRSTRV